MAADRVPVATLRPDLVRGWPAGTRWIAANGPRDAELEQLGGSRVAFPLRGHGRLELRGRVRLAARDGRRGRFRLEVAALDPDGRSALVWKGTLRRLAGRPLPAALEFSGDCELSGAAELVFSVGGGEAVRWSDLELSLASAEEQVAAAGGGTGASGPTPAGEAPRADPGAPLISVITPVHDPPPEILESTLDSVLAQSFEDWELCLFDDGSSDPAVRAILSRYAEADPRVRLARGERASGIAGATNAALELAHGEYVALLDHDDLLVPEALATVAAELRRHPGTDMLYSDEELFEGEAATHVFAKPHWSPDLLRSQMYTCHLGVYRRSLATEVGGFRTDFDGSQDFDFALRVSERSERVRHIPRVLYRWRVHAGSTAGGGQAKPAAYPAARRAIAEHLERTGVEGEVHFGPWQGIYRVVHRLPAGTSVAVAAVGGEDDEPLRPLREAVADPVASGVEGARFVAAPDPAAALAACAEADVVVLCEQPVEPLTRLWLARLAAFAAQPGVAAVGARTLAPDGRVEQSGLAIDAGLPLPLLLGSGAGDPGPLGVGVLPGNVAAVTGTVAFAGAALRQLGGLDPAAGALALPDYCLRGLAAGLRVVSAPDVLLRRVAGPGPANDLAALARFRRRWAEAWPRDPYFELASGWPGADPASGSG